MFKLFSVILISGALSSAWAEYSCTVRTNFKCDADENKKSDSCDGVYCQKVINWCYGYTKESGKKFETEEQIRQRFKTSRKDFAENFELESFINEWKMCNGGVWTWSENKRKTNPEGSSVNGAGSGGLSKEDYEAAGLDDLGINQDDSDEPLCLNAARDIEPETLDILRVREGTDSEAYGSAPEGRKKYAQALQLYLKERLKKLGLDLSFVKRCVGDLPEDLWRFHFDDESAPWMTFADISEKSENTEFKKLMSSQCLQVVLNPKYQTWASLLKIGSSRFSFLEKNAQGKATGRIKTCENVSDARYYRNHPEHENKMEPSLKLGFFLISPALGAADAVFSQTKADNINTAEAMYSGLSFESISRATFVPRSAILENVCPSTSNSQSKTGVLMNVDPSLKNISNIVQAYKRTCESFDGRYENVKYVTANVADIVIIEAAGTVIILSGGTAIPVLIGTSVVAGTLTGAKSYNGCMRTSDIGKTGTTPEYAKQKYEECYSKGLSIAVKTAALNAAFGGVGIGVSRLFIAGTSTTVERYVVTEADAVLPELLTETGLGQRIIMKTAEQVALFGVNIMAGLTKCLVINDMDKNKCDAWAIGREVRNSMLMGFMVERAKALPEIKNLPSADRLKVALKKVTKDPEFLKLKETISSEKPKAPINTTTTVVKTKPKFQPPRPGKFRRNPKTTAEKNPE